MKRPRGNPETTSTTSKDSSSAEVVRRLCLVVLHKIGEETFGSGPARDVLEGFRVALDRDFPELVAIVEQALGGTL